MKTSQNREEKSLRHVAMVVKFLDDNEQKRHLKSEFTLFQNSSILFHFVLISEMLAKFSGVESERIVSNLCSYRICVHLLHKGAREIRSLMSQSCNDG